MGWNEYIKKWYNTGIVVREITATQALEKAIERSTEKGWWK